MTTLIGSRWKHRKVWSRGVLICPVSRAELCIAQPFIHTFNYFLYSMYRTLRVFGSGGLAAGSHPFSFRTRKLSPLEAMVQAQARRVACRQDKEFKTEKAEELNQLLLIPNLTALLYFCTFRVLTFVSGLQV